MPTEKEVTAAADAMMRNMFASHELPLDDELAGKYRECAQQALTAAEQVRAYEGGEMHAINRWMETKGYSSKNFNSLIQILNEIDYQARECGEAAQRAKLLTIRAND
jgi:hypothetical protein